MKFRVTRTSEYDKEKKPTEGAQLESVFYVHERTCKTVEEYDYRFSVREGPWLSKGTNHRLTEVGIARDEPNTAWIIQIESLPDLIAFIQREGGQVVMRHETNWAKGMPSIEIYDTWRE